MAQYQGIKAKALELLAENRYHDSKNFYELHKEELKQGVTVPLRQLILDLSDTLLDIDPEMYVDPVYTVSRIRRDTRYTKDKTLYRENLWVMFRRNKHLYRNCPFLWFEVALTGYNYGIAFFTDKPSDMESFRRQLASDPEGFRTAIQATKKAKLKFAGDFYKKTKEAANIPDDVRPYFNCKNIQFVKYNNNLSKIMDASIVSELRKMLRTVRPMYDFLMEVHQSIVEKESK